MRGRAFTADEIATVRRMAAEGATQRAVAKALGRRAQNVHRVIKREGIVFHNGLGRAKSALIQQERGVEYRAKLAPRVRELTARGLSQRAIATLLESKPDTIRRTMREHGIELVKPEDRPVAKPGSIIRMGRPRLQKSEPHLTADAAMHLARNGYCPVFRADIETLHTPAAFSRMPDAYVVGPRKMPTGDMLALARAKGFAR